jgi:predicted component of type VI protein secretion system
MQEMVRVNLCQAFFGLDCTLMENPNTVDHQIQRLNILVKLINHLADLRLLGDIHDQAVELLRVLLLQGKEVHSPIYRAVGSIDEVG